MDAEFIFMGILPTLISAVSIVWSFLLFMRKRVFLNAFLFMFILTLNGFAISMFIPMLQGAYPIILPHLIVLIAIPILFVQVRLIKNKGHRK